MDVGKDRVRRFLQESRGTPFVVQYAFAISVAGDDRAVVSIKIELVFGDSEKDVRRTAASRIKTLSDAYRNMAGAIVNSQCLGIVDVDEVDDVDDCGFFDLGQVMFATNTKISDLMNADRPDLPNLDQ